MRNSNKATIIVVSDSHGAKDKIDKIFNEYTFDHFIFLGDGLSDLGLYENMQNVTAVRGNCDFFSLEAYSKDIVVAGKRILCTHGNTFEVKRSMLGITKYAKSMSMDIVMFGHTHSKLAYKEDNIWYFNPGALKNGNFLQIDIIGDDVLYKHLQL